MTAFGYSDAGSRVENEDSISCIQKENTVLAMVADGLGGMGNGADASSIMVNTLRERINSDSIDEDILCEAIQLANERIFNLHTEENRMMTTIAVVWTDHETAFAATVGDTRIYQFRDHKIVFQSVDHSVAQMAVFSGKIQKDDIRIYPQRNRILRAVGLEEFVRVDLHELSVQAEDIFLICSDGFWELITESEMEALNNRFRNPEEWFNEMKKQVFSRQTKRSDNHSALVLYIQ